MALVTTALVKDNDTGIPLSAGVMVNAWLYATPDAAATVEAAGYFNNARAKLKKNDLLRAVMVTGGVCVIKQYVFSAVPASGNVTITLQTTTAG